MAETFKNQVDALTGFASTEDDALSDWLTSGAKEIINQLPPNLLKLCCLEQTFTSAAVGNEAESIATGKILAVFASNHEARRISSNKKHQANDSDLIQYATSTDPVYYIQNGKINVLPASLSCQYEEVQYPSITHGGGASGVANFPDEAEYLIVLYAAIKAVERLMLDEEDQEVYAPQLLTLKQDYAQGLAALKGGGQK